MDEVRGRLLPYSRHTREDIDTAYREMHRQAAVILKRGGGVILDSTYGRRGQREEVERIARRAGVSLVPIQCSVPAAVAVDRFRCRGEGHPALDLTAARVELLAEEFSYTPDCLRLDTMTSLPACLRRVWDSLRSASAGSVFSWMDCGLGWPSQAASQGRVGRPELPDTS
jgi:predicted kinase